MLRYALIRMGLDRPYKPATPSTQVAPSQLPKSQRGDSVEYEKSKSITIFESRTDVPLVGFPAGTKVPSCVRKAYFGNPGNGQINVDLLQCGLRPGPSHKTIPILTGYSLPRLRYECSTAPNRGNGEGMPLYAHFMKKRFIERREPVRKSEYGIPVRSRPAHKDRRKKAKYAKEQV